jgi:hypothetical protein
MEAFITTQVLVFTQQCYSYFVTHPVFSDRNNNSEFHVDYAQILRAIGFTNVEKNRMMCL